MIECLVGSEMCIRDRHYQCSSHGYMGNAIQVNSNVVDTPSGGTVRGTLTATAFSGPLTGNVTGNLTGDVTGDLTGDVTGDLTGDVTGDITSSGNSQFTNRLQLKSTDGTPARLDFYCESSNAHYLRLQAPPHSQFSGNPTVVLPNSAGTLLLCLLYTSPSPRDTRSSRMPSSA